MKPAGCRKPDERSGRPAGDRQGASRRPWARAGRRRLLSPIPTENPRTGRCRRMAPLTGPTGRSRRRRTGVAQRLAFGGSQVARRRMLVCLLPGRDHLARTRTERAIRAARVEALRRQCELDASTVRRREVQRSFRRFRRRLRRIGRRRCRRLPLRRRRGREGDIGTGQPGQDDAGANRQPTATRSGSVNGAIDEKPHARPAASPASARYRQARRATAPARRRCSAAVVRRRATGRRRCRAGAGCRSLAATNPASGCIGIGHQSIEGAGRRLAGDGVVQRGRKAVDVGPWPCLADEVNCSGAA